MATWFAQNASCAIETAGWNSEPGGGGTPLVWANLADDDILVLNNKSALSITQPFTCALITNRNTYGGTAGGYMNCASVNVTVHASLLAGSITLLNVSGTEVTVTWYGDVTGGNAVGGRYGIASTLTGISASLVIHGNITSGSAIGSYGLYLNGTAAVTIYGNVTGAGSSAIYDNIGGDALTIIGASVSSNGNAHAVNVLVRPIVVTGDVYGSSSGIYAGILFATSTVVVTGNVIARVGPAIKGTTGTATIVGNITDVESIRAVDAKLVWSGITSLSWWTMWSEGTQLTVVKAPAATDVRKGVHVGNVTGSCAVPAPARVIAPEPIDATVGTYIGPTQGDVRQGTPFGVPPGTGALPLPPTSEVRAGYLYDYLDSKMGVLVLPEESQVRDGVDFGAYDAETETYEFEGQLATAGGPLVGEGGLVE